MSRSDRNSITRDNDVDGYPDQTGSSVSLGDLVEIILKGKWLILGTLVVVVGITAWVTYSEDPMYAASSTVYISTENISGAQFVSADVYTRKLANEFEIIRSSTMSSRVAERIVADSANVPNEPSSILRVEGQLLPEAHLGMILPSLISVSAVNVGVDMFRLTARSTSRAEAAYIANAYADTYKEYNVESARARLKASREFLDDATREFQAELFSAESDLLRFLEREGSIAPGDRANQLVTRMMGLEASQFDTQTQLGMAEAELGEIELEIERIKPGLVRQLTSSDDRLIDRLNEQIAERIIALEQRYAANPALRDNPGQDSEIARIESEIASFRRELDERSARLMEDIVLGAGPDLDVIAAGGSATAARIGILQNLRQRMSEKELEIRMLNARTRLVTNEVQDLRTQIGDLPDRQVILNRLDRSQQIRERLYFSLVEQLQSVRVAERSELGTAEVLDRARGARKVSPNVTRNFQLGGLFGLMLGLVFAFTRHVIDNKVNRPEDLRKRGYDVLGVIPDLRPFVKNELGGAERMSVGDREVGTQVVTLFAPLSACSESYRHLRTNIQFALPDRIVRRILVTSANPSEGKTTTASNIAVTMAEAGRRTLLVDMDLRKPSVHRVFGFDRSPGLAELVLNSGSEAVKEPTRLAAAYKTDIDNLYILPAGRAVPNPPEVLGGARTRDLLRYLSDSFDVIVIDSPPILAVADPILLSTQVDLSLVVVRAASTDWHAVDHAVGAIEDVGGVVGGCVVNDFDAKRAYSKYAYRYGYGYGYYHSAEYYGETEEEQNVAKA